MDEWTKILDKGGKIDSIYMDFMKAFDKVPHRRLLHKMHRYKISEKVIKWVESFLSNRIIKSIYMESIFPPLSIILAHSSITFRSCRVVDFPEMKPNCLLLKSLLVDMYFTIVSLTSFSMVLQITLVRLTGL
jgi:hypothetical protein